MWRESGESNGHVACSVMPCIVSCSAICYMYNDECYVCIHIVVKNHIVNVISDMKEEEQQSTI